MPDFSSLVDLLFFVDRIRLMLWAGYGKEFLSWFYESEGSDVFVYNLEKGARVEKVKDLDFAGDMSTGDYFGSCCYYLRSSSVYTRMEIYYKPIS